MIFRELTESKKNGKGKPSQINNCTIRVIKTEFINNKINLKDDDFEDVFICEDLTPLRAKLPWYVKNCCGNEFVSCHNINEKIQMKRLAWKNGKSVSSTDQRDHGTDD